MTYSNNTSFEDIQFIMEKSFNKEESEDAYFINDSLGIYGVMDGSTPIDKFKDEYGHNGAYLAANIFKNYFESLNQIQYIHYEILQANQLLKQEMILNNIDLYDKSQLWCTCVSAVQIKEDKLIYASLGDTMILARDNKDNVNVLTVNTVKNISFRTKMRREMSRHKCNDIQHERFFQNNYNKIADQRKMANIPNGYSVANGMEEAKHYIQYGMLHVRDLKQILIMSDGLFDPKGDLISVFWKINELGLEDYVKKMNHSERDNRSSSDDKTAILLTF
ncbi:protein phosphatase 2C family protein [Virgibacillus sp. NKC19-3]|uniref:PP2C family serine/threonine-protein phosphatase n=1 Tax=Virgibacillus saliphilus TaxID=2831674 RepID=UPI001C9BB6DB|nr:PP2C family serine/threonine-protein phosphatase [Virgibacillus sp. NKC19-3]MBY7144482.1 protein phosphatase 2C family protein [Virgibacillus sp. NKC19-3]